MHAHPTLPESLMEAALAAEGRAINIQNRRRPARADRSPTAAAAGISKENSVSSQVETQPRAETGPSPDGGAATVSVDMGRLELKKQNRNELLKLYRLMFLIRRFEERAQIEYTKAKIGGYCHLNLGEEATVVGGVVALKPGDYIYTSYREHGHAIARGVDPRAVMAELFGRESGTSHGRGGSMHIFDYQRRFMGGYGIVGGHLPLATGAGFAIKYRRAPDVVFCMFGDGATNIGAFHESLNFAKVFKLPVVWYCINNQYGMGTAVDRASAVSEIYRKACAYDMESIRVDGNDLLEVIRKTSEVVERTRQDSEPRFIEAVNYRSKGHSVVDPDKYRSDEEKQRWRDQDPVIRFELQLVEHRVASREDLERIQDEVDREVEEIVRFSDESPSPDVGELYRYLYADGSEVARQEVRVDG
jgi:pyruvate dehydrogenase E1 component alpha subunit